jgi:hypothetical protein
MGHHDLFFKQTFSIREHAVDFVKHTLPPELAAEMDFNTLTTDIVADCITDHEKYI